MTEIALPWFLLLAFVVASCMAAYHVGRAVERIRRKRRAASFEELWIKKARSRGE